MIEVKVDDDVLFIEKKFIVIENFLEKEPEKVTVPTPEPIREDDDEEEEEDEIGSLDDLVADMDFGDLLGDEPVKDETDDDEEEEDEVKISMDDLETEPEATEPEETEDDIKISIDDLDRDHKESQEDLQAKLTKSLVDLENIRADMSNSFTSTDTISSTIMSIKGMLDAMRKDQLEIQEGMKNLDESLAILDPKKSIQYFHKMQKQLADAGKRALEMDNDIPEKIKDEIEMKTRVSEEFAKRADKILSTNDISKAIEGEKTARYANSSDEDKFTNQLWFDAITHWSNLMVKMN
jgi:hypothetical protein